MRNTLLSALLLAGVFLGSVAQAQGSFEVQNVAEVEVQVKAADGSVTKKRAPADKVGPGGEVIYTTTYKNISAKPAGNVVIKNPIPANTTLVAASPWGENAEVTYSTDGGQTWAAVDKLKIKDAATGKERAAGLTEITHIRWAVRGEVQPGKSGEVGFRTRVN